MVLSTVIAKAPKKTNKVTVAEAAAVMGKSPMWLRIMLREQRLPEWFGNAVQLKSGGKWTYYISPEGLKRFQGECR